MPAPTKRYYQPRKQDKKTRRNVGRPSTKSYKEKSYKEKEEKDKIEDSSDNENDDSCSIM
jgi:hypothetical protein